MSRVKSVGVFIGSQNVPILMAYAAKQTTAQRRQGMRAKIVSDDSLDDKQKKRILDLMRDIDRVRVDGVETCSVSQLALEYIHAADQLFQ